MKADESRRTIEVQINPRRLPRRFRRASKPGTPSALRIPRITRLMALAIKFDEMIRRGEVRDYADLARLGHVSRARITQIMNLLNLAPDIQEEILHLSRAPYGRFPICEAKLRRVTDRVSWAEQRQLWRRLKSTLGRAAH